MNKNVLPGSQPVQKIFEKCAGRSGCEACRPHLEDDCLFFPELYRLNDENIEQGIPLDDKTISRLLDLCTMCGLCPCNDIRMLILEAKAEAARENGISLSAAFLADAARAGRAGTFLSRAVNRCSTSPVLSSVLKKTAGIHEKRALPLFDDHSLFQWVRKLKPNHPETVSAGSGQKVAYFAGCSAGYFFPQVGKAVVNLLEQLEVRVFLPEQNCCGMPLLMEGQKEKALEKIRANVKTLIPAVKKGCKVICSCPTCGYFFRKMLLENAYFSKEAQQRLRSEKDIMQVPMGGRSGRFVNVSRKAYGSLLKDDGYFSSISPVDRIDLAGSVTDLGQFLLDFQKEKNATFKIKDLHKPMAYFAPCHQRELEIGAPYFQLISSMPGSDIRQIGHALSCCGMGGHLGFKKTFHHQSLKIGQPLLRLLESEKDRTLLTDCLSCRLQFSQVLEQKVFHPVELFDVC